VRLDSISDDLVRCGINTRIFTLPFLEWKSLPKVKGCYSIWQGDISIYVGKAGGKNGLPDRFVHHDAKAFTKKRSGTRHTAGWVYYRKHMVDWDPDSWDIEYFEASKEVHRTYLEAAMILRFDPLCNDESFNDRLHNA
jgi:hypothetical protein